MTRLVALWASFEANNFLHELRRANQGYLRAGQSLRLMANEAMAKNLYEMALRKVSRDDHNYKVGSSFHTLGWVSNNDMLFQLLRSLHRKLERRLNPSNSVDPFKVLPHELGVMVIEMLEFRHRVYVSL